MTTIALQERVSISYGLEYIFSFTGRGATKPEAIGPLTEGLWVNFYNSGGEIYIATNLAASSERKELC